MKNNPPVSKRGGARPGAGRPKGVPNRLTSDVKAMILSALDEAGGTDYLVTQSRDNPTAFLTLIGKVLPLQVNGAGADGEHLTTITFRVVNGKP